MKQNSLYPSLRPPDPVIVVDLFPELLDELTRLLAGLAAEEWRWPTICTGWSVHDVALHLLGVDIGNLSVRRDGYSTSPPIYSWRHLVTFLNDWNQSWVETARRISPRLVVDLLASVGPQLNDYFKSLDLYAMGGPVSWAGSEPAPVWLDVAREYTERWHHQQHIRDAVGKPGLKEPRYLGPVLATFARALPRAFEPVRAAEGTSATLTITGPAGGQWSVVREEGAWRLYQGAAEAPAAEGTIDEDAAWRLFTRGLSPREEVEQLALRGNEVLGRRILEVVSIIA